MTLNDSHRADLLARAHRIVDAAAAASRELDQDEEAELARLDAALTTGNLSPAERVRGLAAELTRISEAKAGSERPATPNMAASRELAVGRLRALAAELLGGPGLPDSQRELLRALRATPRPRDAAGLDGYHAVMARFADELARQLRLNEQTAATAEIRAMADPIIAAASAAQEHRNMNTYTSDLPGLWAEFRGAGFAAREVMPSRDLEHRALSTSSSTVPTSFYDRVVVYERTFTPMLNPDVVTIITSTSGEDFTIPRLTADAAGGGTVTAEGGTINAVDPTISSVVLSPFKYASINLWSAELDQDGISEIEDLIARSTARDLGLGAGAHLTTGTGTVQPNGIVTQATNGGTATGTAQTGGASYIAWPDLVGLYGSLAAPYRAAGSWMMSSDALSHVLSFRDDSGMPIWSLGRDDRIRILGKPIFENPAMEALGSASKSVLFGDLSRYIVRRVSPARVEISRDYKYDTDQVALKVVERLDGALVDTAAVKYLVSANT